MSVDVGVVGGGIGGLSAALALAGDGHRVTVLERAGRFEAVGAGIVLAPNAVRVPAALGVDLTVAGRVLAGTEVHAADGKRLNAIDLATTCSSSTGRSGGGPGSCCSATPPTR